MEDLDEIKTALRELAGAAGVVSELKGQVTDLSARLKAEAKEREELEKRFNRAGVGGGASPRDSELKAAREALAGFVRNGSDQELKAMSVGSDPDGGYLVVPTLADQINRKVFDVSPIARLARRIQIDGDAYEEPIDASDIGASWVGEHDPRTPGASPQLQALRIPLDEIAATQKVTQKLLDTSRFALGAWLEDKIADKFSRTEGAAFISGNGVGKPMGLLSGSTATTADGVRPWFSIQYIATGVSGDFAATNPVDKLVDLAYSLRAPYRANARWLVNRSTAGKMQRFKDSQGRYLWADGIAAGMMPSLLCFPVEIDEQMPDIGADSFSVAFGDFEQAYTIVEQPGLKLLRDPYSDKPSVLFYAYRRVGGAVANGEAVKLLKFGTS